jgi:DNA-binding winged helix-turn-helix (wHTH) protein
MLTHTFIDFGSGPLYPTKESRVIYVETVPERGYRFAAAVRRSS